MEYQNHSFEVSPNSESAMAVYMTRVFGWMTLALTLTALTAWLVGSTMLINLLIANKLLFLGMVFGELILVGALAGWVNKMNAAVATIVFLAYSILNGVTLSVLLLRYTEASIIACFLITAGTFAFMCAYGYFTNKDLTSMGSFLLMSLVGIVIASVVNWFMQSETLYWIISYAGLFIFVGLTAYDAQKIKMQGQYMVNESGEVVQKGSIMGALTLYLDFINLFIFILRIFGGRK